MAGFMDYMRAYYKVARLEYAPGEVPAIFFPLLLGASTLADFYKPVVLEALVVFILLYLAGFIINSLADRDLDRKYGTFKGGISDGVDVFGVAGTKALLAGHVVTAFVLTAHITIWTGDPTFIIIASVGAFLGLGYSVRPFHFKVRGWWHAVSLGISAYFIPFLFLYYAASGAFVPIEVLFITCFTVAHYSLEMANQAADAKEDRDEGLMTPAARWGVSRTLYWSRVGTAFGVAMAILVLYYFFITGLPMFAPMGGVDPMNPFLAVGLLTLVTVIMVAAYSIPIRGEHELYRISTLDISEDEKSRRIKERIRFSDWQAAGVSGGVTCLFMLFILGYVFTPSPGDGGPGDGSVLPLDMSVGDVDFHVTHPVSGFIEGELHVDALVKLEFNGSDRQDPGPYSVVGSSYFAGQRFHGAESPVTEDWTARLSLKVHDAEDTAFRYQLVGPDGEVLQTYDEPSEVDLYIVETDLVQPDELFEPHEVAVTVWNAGPLRETETVTVTLTVKRIVEPFHEVYLETNPEALVEGSDWTVSFPVDLLETVTEYWVQVDYNGAQTDFLSQPVDGAGE